MGWLRQSGQVALATPDWRLCRTVIFITDDEGETVAYDYPPDYYFLEEYVNDMVSKMEFEVYPEEAEKAITDAFEKYAHKYYTVKNIEWFQDYSIEKVIEKSKVSEKWRVDFDLMEQRKRTFMNLSIAKKVIKILQGQVEIYFLFFKPNMV